MSAVAKSAAALMCGLLGATGGTGDDFGVARLIAAFTVPCGALNAFQFAAAFWDVGQDNADTKSNHG
jgi:hypothetical protein